MIKLLTGKDYPHVCELCRSAVDDAAMLLADGIDDAYMDDEEAPMMYAYDRGWLCGVGSCDVGVKPQPEMRYVATIIQWQADKNLSLRPVKRLHRAAVTYRLSDMKDFLNKVGSHVFGDYHDGWTWANSGRTLEELRYPSDPRPWTEIVVTAEFGCLFCDKWGDDCNCAIEMAQRRVEYAYDRA